MSTGYCDCAHDKNWFRPWQAYSSWSLAYDFNAHFELVFGVHEYEVFPIQNIPIY